MQLHAAIITLLNVLLITAAMFMVARARGKYGIKAPATQGPEGFERAFRAHMNTIEATIMFLPVLWLATIYLPVPAIYVQIAGYLWIVGRTWYLFGYLAAAGKRSMGFIVAFVGWLALLLIASWGVIKVAIAS